MNKPLKKESIIKLLKSLLHYEKGYSTDYGCLNTEVYVEHKDNHYMESDVEKVQKFLKGLGVKIDG
jgi:hypothetical protein